MFQCLQFINLLLLCLHHTIRNKDMTTFTNTIENFNGQSVKVENFNTKEEAKKAVRKLMKEFGMVKHAGHVVNYSGHVELFTNY